jgi:hypothetical protein
VSPSEEKVGIQEDAQMGEEKHESSRKQTCNTFSLIVSKQRANLCNAIYQQLSALVHPDVRTKLHHEAA